MSLWATPFQLEGLLVLCAHVVTWFYYADRVWNMSDMPPSEIADIRQQFSSSNIVSRPAVLRANRLWRCVLREAMLGVTLWALARNYFHGHQSWVVAMFFLASTVVAIEVLRRFNRRRYRQDLRFCRQALSASVQQSAEHREAVA
ncbi:MAG: hypothetical protein KBD27_01530 [Candidatus Moranbacteria bacterium]|nr:hypothetical protein [Candidatus Moranbacteria bacterium]